jgi:hypothetical protein
MAALRYALANGLVVQRDSVLVAWEPPGEKLSNAAIPRAREEARELARLISPFARDTNERSVLQCNAMPSGHGGVFYDCASSTRYAVVVVWEPEGASTAPSSERLVAVEVYTPGFRRNERSMQSFAVNVSGAGNSWAGTSFRRVVDRIRPVRISPTVATSSNWPATVRFASDAEQRAIEIAAAGHLYPGDTTAYSTMGFALDPRLYTLGWNEPASREAVTSSVARTSQAATHLISLGSRLKTSAVINDASNCAVFRPSPCRMGSHPGVVSFSQTLVRDDEAQISVFWIERAKAGTAAPGRIVGWRFTLTGSGNRWFVHDSEFRVGG